MAKIQKNQLYILEVEKSKAGQWFLIMDFGVHNKRDGVKDYQTESQSLGRWAGTSDINERGQTDLTE